MKRLISISSAAALVLASLLAMPTAALAAPADFAEWPACLTADDQHCVEAASLKLSDGTSTTLAAEGVRLEAYYFTLDPIKVIVVNLRAGTGQDLPEKLLGAALSFTLRTSTWQPSNSMSGQAGFVSYSTAKVGTNFKLSATATTIRYELNKDCNLDAKLCDGAADQVYKAFLQVNFAPTESPFDSAVLTTSGNREGAGWSANATRVFDLIQPKAAPFQMDTMLLNSELSKTLGSTAAFVAKNFKAVLTQNGIAVGTPTLVATSWGVLVQAKHSTGGVMKLTVSPKTPLPRPVIQKVNVVSKSKQTVTVRASKAAKLISVSCSTSNGTLRNFTSKTFTFTPTMPKGVWLCSASFVNGYRGPSSTTFMLSNRG
jgi:hypothetical protein